jgi:ferric-dicitrate binding protein FerR (iron transport regulator)
MMTTSDVRSVDGSATLSWREGSYHYEGAALATIVSDLRRYYRKPIMLASPALNEMRFTGVVNLTSNDIEQWLAGLQSLDDIEINVREDAVIVSQVEQRASK